MVVVGALARIDAAQRGSLTVAVERLEGASAFSVGDPERLGVVVECPDLARAKDLLARRVARLEGVQEVWPVYFGTEQDEALRRGGRSPSERAGPGARKGSLLEAT